MGRKLVLVFEIIAAVVFIAVMTYVFQGVLSIGNKAKNDIDAASEMVIDSELQPYNDQDVSGDMVIALIKKSEYVSSTSIRYSFSVDGYSYGWVSGGTSYVGYSSTVNKINPVDNYYAELVENDNNVITGVKFTKR